MSDVTNDEVVEKKIEPKKVEPQKVEAKKIEAKKVEVTETEQDENLIEAFDNLKLPFEGKRTVFTSPDASSRAYRVHWTMKDYEKENK